MDDIQEKINMINDNTNEFLVSIHNHLTLLTIRHYTNHVINELLFGKKIILEQKTAETLQVLFEELPV